MAAKTASSTQRAARVVQPAIPDFDRLIHEKTRLAIVSALAVNPTLTFNEVKAILKTTDGNVSVHTRKLEEANYITCRKSFEGRMPRTEYALPFLVARISASMCPRYFSSARLRSTS